MSLLGKLVNNTIDIAAADFTITAARSEAVDFLPVLIESFIQAFIANPEGRQNWMAFVEPVTWQAWLGIFTFLLLAPPIICCVFFYGTKTCHIVLKVVLRDFMCLKNHNIFLIT